ncbi:MAG: hypothetical protein SYR96_35535 [Actinomycetota bacterium]|nr:hypothetical protein [Actinomycetota bacterium]
MLGAIRDCERSLDTAALLAEHLRDASPGDHQPSGPPGSTTVPDLHDAAAGWCFYDFGQPARAIRLLRPAVERIAPEARRSRGLFGARLVLAHIAVGDLEAACERGHEVLQALRFAGSASTYGELRDAPPW